jgi:hypothetical protein
MAIADRIGINASGVIFYLDSGTHAHGEANAELEI